MGPNGSGKTTLLKLIARQMKPLGRCPSPWISPCSTNA
ncbi:ATP-binding cassette domain-containing protein [Rhizobium gallicum]|nr:ATP-binding cassette domain-containing protein [Rhizobium gallicum]ULJ76680.1 ATP-binding cassette domain-containing protein [Rhizobium gallicum]